MPNNCEQCGLVSKNYGTPKENIRRWCAACARAHGGVLLSRYNAKTAKAAAAAAAANAQGSTDWKITKVLGCAAAAVPSATVVVVPTAVLPTENVPTVPAVPVPIAKKRKKNVITGSTDWKVRSPNSKKPKVRF